MADNRNQDVQAEQDLGQLLRVRREKLAALLKTATTPS